MKINLYTTPQLCYSKNSKAKQNQSDNSSMDYLSKDFSQSFKGASLFSKVAAVSFVSSIGLTPRKTISRLYDVYAKKEAPKGLVKANIDRIRSAISTEDKLFNNRISLFVNALVDRLSPKSPNSDDLDGIAGLAEKYQKHDSARFLMQEAVEERTAGGKYRFSISELASPNGLFGGDYQGSELQNEIIRFVKNAKNSQGNPRFTGFDASSFKDITKKQFEKIVKPLLSQKIIIPIENTEAAFQRAGDALKEAEILAEQDGKNRIRHFDVIMQDSPLVVHNERYLVDYVHGLPYIAGIIQECTQHPEKLEIFNEILPKVEKPQQLLEILKAYTPEKHDKYEKFMQEVEAGKLYIGKVPFWIS